MTSFFTKHWFRSKHLLVIAIAMSIVTSFAKEPPIPSNASLPPAFSGTWIVTEVHVDTGATRTLHYQHNDPLLTGRFVMINHDQITSNTPEEKLCKFPRVASRLKISDLIEKSMVGRNIGPETPTATDYEINLPTDVEAEAVTVNCEDGLWAGGLGRENGIGGAWIVALSNDKLAIRWYDETILVLKRLPEDPIPRPSFRCDKAVSVTEKTICKSVALAAFDRSVADSYAFAIQQFKELQNPQGLSRFKVSQKEWLYRRNHCGDNVDCLQKIMESRLQEIDAMSYETK